MRSLNALKKVVANKFDKIVKSAINRAIPTVKKEAAKVMKQSSEKTISQIINIAKTVALGAAIFYPLATSSQVFEHVAPISDTFDGIRDMIVHIDNLTINFNDVGR